MAITALATELKAAGRDIISLSVGEPDFDTPDNIRAAGIAAIERGETRYTVFDGRIELKRAICGKFKRENGLDYETSQITVSNGGKHVLYNAMVATLNRGDEVVIPAPYWVSYPEMVLLVRRRAGGGAVPAEQRLQAASRGPRSGDHAENQMADPQLAVEPDGCGLHRSRFEGTRRGAAQARHVWIMTDDMYEHVIYDNFQYRTIAQVEPRLYERTLTVNGVSKAYCMTGWRIGYAGGPQHLIKAMGAIQSNSTANPCSISQAAAIEALNGPQDFIPRHALLFKERRDLVVDLLNKIPGIHCPRPDGAFYVYPSCAGLLGKRTPVGRHDRE